MTSFYINYFMILCQLLIVEPVFHVVCIHFSKLSSITENYHFHVKHRNIVISLSNVFIRQRHFHKDRCHQKESPYMVSLKIQQYGSGNMLDILLPNNHTFS